MPIIDNISPARAKARAVSWPTAYVISSKIVPEYVRVFALHELNHRMPVLSKSWAHVSRRARCESLIISPRRNATNNLSEANLICLAACTFLAPFQFFIEARYKAQLAERGIFSAPASFLAMNLTYEWIHSSSPAMIVLRRDATARCTRSRDIHPAMTAPQTCYIIPA